MQLQWGLYNVLLQLLLTLAFISTTTSESYYSAVAPGTIKSNRNYSVCLSLHNAPRPAVIHVSLIGKPLFNYVQNVDLQPFETKTISFLPPKLDSRLNYSLEIEGVEGFVFYNSTKLQADPIDSLKIYIQTDKGTYKPSDVVQFRIVVLDEHLKPFKAIEPIQVEIVDPNGNRIKQFKDIKLKTGVYTNKFNLSEQTVLGQWLILASVLGKYEKSSGRNFKVEKYVLPKFGVYIDADSDFILDDNEFSLTVYGKYTFGKYVEGTATVAILNPATNMTMSRQEAPLENYRASFTFQYYDIPLTQMFSWIIISATIKERHTGITQSTLQELSVRKQKYNILVPENEIEFHNGKPYKIKAMVQHWNGSRVLDTITPLTMIHANRTYETHLDANGVGTFTFDYVDKEVNVFNYAGSSTHLQNIVISQNYRFEQSSATACSLKWKQGRLKFGTTIDLELTSKLPIPYFVYTVTSHADIVRMKYIPLPRNTKSHIIKIKPAIDMIPRCYVYVHYIVNGDLCYCELSLKFPSEFENTVSISAPPMANPGQEVQLDLNAKPDSYVGLLAVDLSVYLVNPDFNIDRERIFRELAFDLTFSGVDVIYPGQISGLVTLTNANYFYETPIEKFEKPRSKMEYDTFRTEKLNIRSKFPETWIFMDLENVNEMTQLSFNVPDTITTWLITVFSVNDESGFGMMTEPTNLTVFKTFFISTNLPYLRGEIVKIPLVIFNYHNEDLDTRITMKSLDGDYDFIDELTMHSMGTTTKSQDIIASANGGNTLFFFIKPKKLGVIRINIKATNHLYNDAILQELLVEPTGTMETHNKDLFINLKKNEPIFRSSIDIDLPENHVADTEFLLLSVSSDILHTTLDNLDSLVQLPTGCAEQNMVNFAPNVLVLDHLRAIRKSSENSELVKRATGHLEVGYQQELSYRHYNGAYSVFGPNARTEESTWLTAYITRFFIKAQRYAGIESRIIQSGLHFLKSKQLPSGEFQYTGYLFHPAHQDRYGFTAFVLMTFLESSKSSRNYKSVIQKGVNYLAENINNINDSYALSLVAVALQMAKSEHTIEVLEKLQQKSQSNNGLKWWPSSKPAHSNDVEITAYALMALLGTNSLDNVNIVKWILEQRNKAGGFKTTHDTVVALQALIRFNQKYPSTDGTLLKFNYAALDDQGLEVSNGFLGIDPSNRKIWQQIELPKTTRLLQLKIEGEGNALVQLAYHYYIPLETDVESITLDNVTVSATTFAKSSSITNRRETPKHPQSFSISPMAKLTSNAVMELEVCFKFKPSEELKHRQTNMVIMEINMPSGFVVTPESVHDLQEEEFVARVEVKNSNTKCLAYFKHLLADEDEKCLSIQADKTHEITLLEPASIIMYDYYIPENRDTIAYQIQS